MRRRSTFRLRDLRRFSGAAALLLLLQALIPHGYMPALAKAGPGETNRAQAGDAEAGARTFAFVICHGATLDGLPAQDEAPSAADAPAKEPANAPGGADCPFAAVSGAALLLMAAPVILARPQARARDLPPRPWTEPSLPFFPRPSGARAPPFSRA